MNRLEALKPLALLLLRLALGAIFIYHGYPKLFGDTQDAMASFVRMGFPGYFVYIAGAVELFGGSMLVLGLFARVAALLLTGEMAVALWKVHLPHGGVMAVDQYQLPLALAAAAFVLAATGAGIISADQLAFGRRKASRRPRD
jgi:putative oxidoreductase